MKTRWFLFLVLAVLSLVAPTRLLAQDLAGNWQGTMQIGREIRVVFKISNADGVLRAVMYSIDQGGQGIPVSSVTLQGTTVRMAIPGIGATYEGKLGPDSNSITGTTTQGPNKMALNLVRTTAATAWAIPEPPAPPKPMAADAVAAFEVATIKPSQPNAPGKSILVRGRQFSTTNTTLADLIGFTYGVHAKQIVGGPGWLETEKFDITARPSGDGQPNEKQWKTMLQKLLAERFSLAFHPDKQELAVFAFTVLKTGPKLTPSTGDPNGLPGLGFRGPGAMIARNATVRDLAATLQMGLLDRPVVDQTALPGRYDFTLTFTPDDFQFGGAKMPPPTDGSAPPPNMFTAIQEQLGLKLETTRAPADVLAIDRVEKPSPD